MDSVRNCFQLSDCAIKKSNPQICVHYKYIKFSDKIQAYESFEEIIKFE